MCADAFKCNKLPQEILLRHTTDISMRQTKQGEQSYLIFSRKPVSNVYFRTKKECLPENKLGSGGKLGEPQHTLPPLQQGPPSGARTGTPPSDGDHLQGAGALLCRQGAAVRSKGNIPPSHCWQGEHLRKLKLFNNKYILSGNNQLHQYCLVSCN